MVFGAMLTLIFVLCAFLLHARAERRVLQDSIAEIKKTSFAVAADGSEPIQLPKISEAELNVSTSDGEVWSTSYLKILALSLVQTFKGSTFCFHLSGRNYPEVVCSHDDPLLKVIIASTINLDNSTCTDIAGAFERHGYCKTKVHFFEVPDGTKMAVWAGFTQDEVLQVTRLQTLFPQLERRIEDAYRRMESHVAAQQPQSAKIHTRFLQQVSHDIRSPLNNVRSVLNIFMLEEDIPGRKELLDVAIKNVDAMSEIVETILEFSSQSAGHLRVFKEDFSLDTFLKDIVDAHAVEARLKNIELEVHSEPHCIVRGDPRHIRRVINNLVSNAIKYTTQGKVTVSAVSRGSDITISVTDTGIGMTEKEIGELFKPFARFQRSLADGAGLGLVVAKQLVEANGGNIEVDSLYGSGSTFVLTLPKGESASQYLLEAKLQSSANQSVLLIDDDKDWLHSFEKILSASGFQITIATSIIEAIGLLKLASYDFIISDYEMKGGSPSSLVGVLEEGNIPTQVLIVSGGDPAKLRTEFPSCTVMQKPIDVHEVRNWLFGREPLRAVA